MEIQNRILDGIDENEDLDIKSGQKIQQNFNTNFNANQKDEVLDTDVKVQYNNLWEYVCDISNRMNKLMQKTEEDFLTAYKKQMSDIQKELKNLKKKMDEETLKQKADTKMNILEQERDYFRAEALRLDKVSKDQIRDIEELKFKMSILEEDKNYYEGFVIETKKENKSLKSELLFLYKNKVQEGNMGSYQHREEENIEKFSDLQADNSPQNQQNNQENTKKEGYQPFFPTQVNIDKRPVTHAHPTRNLQSMELSDQKEFDILRTNEKKLVETIKQLRQYLEKEKQINRKMKTELCSQNQEKTDLEQILMDCIQEAKSEIKKRRVAQKEHVINLKSSQTPQNINQLLDIEVNYQNFSHQDKIMLLKKFIQSDQFLDKIYEMTFGFSQQSKRQNIIQKEICKRAPSSSTRATLTKTAAQNNRIPGLKLTEQWKHDYKEANELYNKQFKGFRYSFSAKSFGHKNASKKDLQSTHFQFSGQTQEKINLIKYGF